MDCDLWCCGRSLMRHEPSGVDFSEGDPGCYASANAGAARWEMKVFHICISCVPQPGDWDGPETTLQWLRVRYLLMVMFFSWED